MDGPNSKNNKMLTELDVQDLIIMKKCLERGLQHNVYIYQEVLTVQKLQSKINNVLMRAQQRQANKLS